MILDMIYAGTPEYNKTMYYYVIDWSTLSN